MFANIILQIQEGTSAAVQTTSGVIQTENATNIIDLAVKGGWIMIVLGVLFIIAVYIFIERYIALNNAVQEDENLINDIKTYINKGDLEGARILTKNDDTPIGKMLDKGLAKIGRPLNDINQALDSVGNIEMTKLKNGVSFLETIAFLSLSLGLLGTAIGLLKAFFMASTGSNENIQLLFSAISESMIIVILGLIVCIICKLLYSFLRNRMNKVLFSLETRKMEFMDFLQEPANL